MTKKKETIGYGLALIAMIGCCLLLTALIAGGGLALAGGFFNNPWLLILGLGIIVLAIIVFIQNKTKDEKSKKTQNDEEVKESFDKKRK